ncbi:MAG: mannose-1-phosphate guanylyltransferase [Verrucomicrobiales bacterium]
MKSKSKPSSKASTKTSNSDNYVIIMAGGRGERFWPVSREKTPKQLITLLGKRSFLQQAVDRVLPVVPLKNILIITNKVQAPAVQKQLPKLPKANIIAEPIGRDTCAAVTLGAALVGARSPTGVMAVLPADHVIPDEKEFQQVLLDSLNAARAGNQIVTIGIQPTEPATGYGYIQMSSPLEGQAGKTPFYKVERFVEKPKHEKAVEYVDSGNFRWNAGMFIWSYPTIKAALDAHQPEMAAACERWAKAVQAGKLERVLAKEYPAITKISIDFALLEKAKNVIMAEGAFTWDDLGAWTALARHLAADANGNCTVGELLEVDSSRNIIFDNRKKNKTPIALVGIKDSIIVQTDDVTLVASKAEGQKIKDLVKKLGESNKHKALV